MEKDSSLMGYLRRNYDMYLLLIPGIVFIIIFHYLPLLGITIAFKDFNLFNGRTPIQAVVNSPWVGFDHFADIFQRGEFYRVLWNTIIISAYKLVFLFPLPIMLAILLNEIRCGYYKKVLQTVLYS